MKKIIIAVIIITAVIILSAIYAIYPYIEPGLYPRPAGIDKRTGLPLEKIYFCMDICPAYGTTFIVYKDINTTEQCEAIGGRPILTGVPSPGLFIGCGTGQNTK